MAEANGKVEVELMLLAKLMKLSGAEETDSERDIVEEEGLSVELTANGQFSS